ncbi:MAG: ferrochelatase [Proteobacteria bacterium]|nr:ferrochelatase [Pseudomonadota bacterium]
MKNCKTGVVLLNMGGPDTLDDVQPFLYNLFCDREIIRLGPALLQKPLAWLISRRRAPKSKANYAQIGGGSPLKKITWQQAKALEESLRQDGNYAVAVAMRYWPPFADEALGSLLQQRVDQIIVLTLYPHFSKATTGSSVSHFRRCLHRLAPRLPLKVIASWPTQPYYIKALAENIACGMQAFDSAEVTILYSAHSLPVSFIKEGDPYVDHINQTIQALEKITGIHGRICYQSRSGPVEWLAPSTPEMLEQLAMEGCKNVLMVPISFVSDHIETLFEIRILYKESAAQLGIQLHACPSLNVNPTFISALRELVIEGGLGTSFRP